MLEKARENSVCRPPETEKVQWYWHRIQLSLEAVSGEIVERTGITPPGQVQGNVRVPAAQWEMTRRECPRQVAPTGAPRAVVDASVVGWKRVRLLAGPVQVSRYGAARLALAVTLALGVSCSVDRSGLGPDVNGPAPVVLCGSDVCAAGQMCCAGQCVADRCDDGNPCTTDICGVSGCIHTTAEGTRCNDGLFCNGIDTCGSDGTCSVHSGNPCDGDLTCDEALGACLGCDEDNPCPSDTESVTECDFTGLATCVTDGRRTRTTTTYACVQRACVATQSDQSETCSRDTEALSCDDGDACTVSGVCRNGECMKGLEDCRAVLGNYNPCVDARCHPVQGCVTRDNDDNACGFLDVPDAVSDRNRDCSHYVCDNGECKRDDERDQGIPCEYTPENLCGGLCDGKGECEDLSSCP